MRILYIAEIVGKAGIFCVKSALSAVKREHAVDFVIANGDGATGGYGLGKNHSVYLRKLGVDVITGGDQFFFKKDMAEHIEKAFFLLRPANLPPEMPGRGWRHYSVNKSGPRVVVVSLLGQSGFGRIHASNPFSYLESMAERFHRDAATVIVDFHAMTTAEKYTMCYFADGLVSAVIGSGQRVATADLQLSARGTAFVCDAGRTGSQESVGGFDPAPEIKRLMTAVPNRSQEHWALPQLTALLLDVDPQTGKTSAVERLNVPCEPTGAAQPEDQDDSDDSDGNGPPD